MPGTELSATRAPGLMGVQQMFNTSLCEMQYQLGEAARHWSVASFGGITLDGISIYRDEAVGARHAIRNRSHIAAAPTDVFLLAMPFSAHICHTQNGQHGRCGPGHAILFPVSRPFSSSIQALSTDGRYTQCLSKVSGTLLRQRVPHVDALGSVIFPVHSGAGKILKSLLELAMEEGHTLSEAQSGNFSHMLVDAIANVLVGFDAGAPLAPVGARTALDRLRHKAIGFIDSHLGDPSLDVEQIAAHCQVSERYLHAAFAAANTKIGSHIREARLLACQSALRNPALARTAVTDIALHWGFNDPAHFSRAYKTRFGLPPSQDRG